MNTNPASSQYRAPFNFALFPFFTLILGAIVFCLSNMSSHSFFGKNSAHDIYAVIALVFYAVSMCTFASIFASPKRIHNSFERGRSLQTLVCIALAALLVTLPTLMSQQTGVVMTF